MSVPIIYLISLAAFLGINAVLFFFWLRWVKNAKEEAEETEETKTPTPPELRTENLTLTLPDERQLSIRLTDEISEDPAEAHQITTTDQVMRLEVHPDGYFTAGVVKLPPWYTPAGLLTRLKAVFREWPYPLAETLFIGALLVYTITRLVGLQDYPIFFFTDEAIQTNLAADFLRDNFYNYDGEFFPTYFENVDKYSLSTTVYIQILPYLFFGKSVFVTRAASALVTVLGAYWLGRILKDILELKYWWLSVLLLAISPAWFLHSRTAFETCMFSAIFAGFLYYYMRYRKGEEDRDLYLALILGALAFYTYNPGRVAIVLTGAGFLLSNLRFHRCNWKTGLKGLSLLVILALPFLRFYLAHATAQTDQLRLLASYWVKPIATKEKLSIFFEYYLYGLSPGYWFIPNQQDLSRHLMGSYPHLLTSTLPFIALGGLLSLRRFRDSAYRSILIALLAAPAGSALVTIGVTRAMVYIIPAVLLTAVGLIAGLEWLERRGLARTWVAIAIFTLLSAVSMGIMVDALTNGPTWETNYALSGTQYGARQLYAKVEDFLEANPDAELYISPNWTNGADVVARFFLPDPLPFEFGGIDRYLNYFYPDVDEKVFIMPPEEFDAVLDSGKFQNIRILDTVPYPTGDPGFYFFQMEYVDNIAEILAEEIAERARPVNTTMNLGDELVEIQHSRLDMGSISLIFDQDTHTVTRTQAANPFVIEIFFPEAHEFIGFSVQTGSADVEITLTLTLTTDPLPFVIGRDFAGTVEEPVFEMDFNQPITADHVRLSILDLDQSEPAHVHLWEFTLLED